MLKHTGAASRTLFLIKSYTIDFHWCPLRRPFLSFNRTIPWNNSTRSCLLFLVFVICKIGSPTRMYKPARNGTFLRWRRAMISDIQAWHVVQDADMFGHSPFESHSIDRGMYRRWQIDGFSHDCCDWVAGSIKRLLVYAQCRIPNNSAWWCTWLVAANSLTLFPPFTAWIECLHEQ